jgi:diguanylate cyclase (GGDEF)-like protein
VRPISISTPSLIIHSLSQSRRSLFERALDALPDGVLLTNASRDVVYANPAFARHWNIPGEVLSEGNDNRLLKFVQDQLVDPDAFRREVERINPTSESSEDEIRLKDGRVLSRRSVPFEEDGRFEARLWIFTDVTEARHARTDALCGLPNRRAYSTDFPIFAQSADDGLIKAVGIMDIDNFKGYNDRYGHAAGDLVLRQIGNLLRHHLAKADDMVFRIGGEEFLLACKAREEGEALSFFEALRCSVAAMSLTHLSNPPYNVVTASFGLGVFRGPRDPGELFTSIDTELYQAKASGRNAISVANLPHETLALTVG